MSKCPFRNQTHIAAVCLSRSYDPQVSGRVSSLPLFLSLFFSLSTVICNFRGSVTQGLALEVGETVQILEKCEGKTVYLMNISVRLCVGGRLIQTAITSLIIVQQNVTEASRVSVNILQGETEMQFSSSSVIFLKMAAPIAPV